MNISFDGTISNTLPNDDGTFFKRSRCELGLVQDNIKRVRRGPSGSSGNNDGANQHMNDDSFSSAASLDELAETLREVNQRLDSSLLDFSSSTLSMRRGGGTGMNTSMNSHSRFHMSSSSSLNFHNSMNFNNHHHHHNTAAVATPAAAVTNSAPLLASRGPPPLMNFTRIPRSNSPDRL